MNVSYFDLRGAANDLRAEHGDNAEAQARILHHAAREHHTEQEALFWLHVLGELINQKHYTETKYSITARQLGLHQNWLALVLAPQSD